MTTQTWTIDPAHTEVGFAVRHLMISTVKGRFADVKGAVTIPDEGEPTLDVTIGAASIDPARRNATSIFVPRTSSTRRHILRSAS